MKLIIFMILFVLLAGVLLIEPSAYQADLEREFTLETTFDPDRYATLTANGNTIYAEGFFRGDVVEDFFITPLSAAAGSFTRQGNGSFTASFSGTPADGAESHALAVIKLEGGRTLSYRVEYASGAGWFFGDNGLAASNALVFHDYRVISPEISENYISASLCPREIADTRDRLMEIVHDVAGELTCDYQTAKALSHWVAENIVYDRDAKERDVTEEVISIAQTLQLRRSVCIGIANTYAALLETAGIKALNIKGGIVNAREGVPYELLPYKTIVHEWVAFWFEEDSRWVWTDPTWDRTGTFESGNYLHRPSVMKHFDISPLALSLDHRADRAELRQFLPINVGDDDPVVPHDEYEEPEEHGRTESSDPTPPQIIEENHTIFYIIIAAMSIAAIIMVIIIYRIRR